MRGVGLVKYVASGNQIVLLVGNSDDARYNNQEKRFYIAGLSAPRMAIKTTTADEPDEPFAFECREFLRSKVIGKTVKFELVGIHNGREYLTVSYDDKDLAAMMISEGYGKTAPEAFLPQPANITDLVLVEKLAKEEKMGIWSETPAVPRNIKWTVSDIHFVKGFAEKHRNSELQGIVEYVRDADALKIYFPEEQVMAQCLMTGVSCPQTRKQPGTEGEPFAAEAKDFVELRLLGRSLKFRVDGCDNFANLFVSPMHPRGSIIELLLSEGFAKINENSAKFYPEQSRLRELIKEAQARRIRRWQKLESVVPAKIPDQTAAEGGSPKARSFMARVIEMYSGDSFSVVALSKLSSPVNPPPCEIIQHEQRLYLSSIRCPRGRTRSREAEPYAHEAVEFAKEFCAGKKVRVSVDYIRTPTPSTTGGDPPPASDDMGRLYFCTMYVGDTSLNMELVKQGLAKAQRHRVEEDRAEQYDELLIAETEAQESKRGVHSNKEYVKHRINDLCGQPNVQKARAMEQSFRREGNIKIHVDFILNGGRYRCTAPQMSTQFTFVLSGLRAPQAARVNPGGTTTPGQPFAEESIAWARFHLLHRTFVVQVNACDRGGSFIGQMWRPDSIGKDSVNARVLKAGLARTDELGLRLCPIAQDLTAAEAAAVEKRVGLWALPELVEEWQASMSHESVSTAPSPWAHSLALASETLLDLGVSHVESAGEIYCQTISDDAKLHDMQALTNKLGDEREDSFQERFTIQKPPKIGDIVLCRFTADNMWYRGRVVSVEGLKFGIFYIDYGNKEKASIDRLLKTPPEVNIIVYPPFAKCFSLAGVKVLKEQEHAALSFLNDLTSASSLELKATVVGARDAVSGATPAVLSVVGEETSINQELVAAGLARVALSAVGSSAFPKSEAEALFSQEKAAKSKRLGVWFYGDVGHSDDEDEDDAMPPLRR